MCHRNVSLLQGMSLLLPWATRLIAAVGLFSKPALVGFLVARVQLNALCLVRCRVPSKAKPAAHNSLPVANGRIVKRKAGGPPSAPVLTAMLQQAQHGAAGAPYEKCGLHKHCTKPTGHTDFCITTAAGAAAYNAAAGEWTVLLGGWECAHMSPTSKAETSPFYCDGSVASSKQSSR